MDGGGDIFTKCYRPSSTLMTVALPSSAYRPLYGPWGQRQKGGSRRRGWEILRRGEAEIAAAKHRGGEAVHHGLSLHMQVSVHLV